MGIAWRAVMLDEDDRTAGLAHRAGQSVQPADQPCRIVPRGRRAERALLHVDDEQGVGHQVLPPLPGRGPV